MGKKEKVYVDENGHALKTMVDGDVTYNYTYTGIYPEESGMPELPSAYSTTKTESFWNGTKITDNRGNVILTETP